MAQPRVVVDITTLQKWRRFPVGIVRTQLEFTKYCLYELDSSGFIAFDDSKSMISNVNKSDVSALIQEYENESWEEAYTPSKVRDIGRIKSIRKLYAIIKRKEYLRLIKAVYVRTPTKIRNPVRRVLEPILRKKIEFLTANSSASISEVLYSPEVFLAEKSNAVLSASDIVVCMGLDWDFSNYNILMELKKIHKFKVVTCFYDAIPLSHPNLVNSSYFGKVFFAHLYKLNYLSDKVFCISNFSKKSYEKIAKETRFSYIPNLKTIYLGDDVKKKTTSKSATDGSGYALYVSTIEARKNHVRLLKVWKKLIEKFGGNTPKLILVGMKGWGVDEFYELYNSCKKLRCFVEIRSNVSDNELSGLYSQAKFCVFPSLVEGWGLGAAESLSYGKVCLISDCEALYEATQGLMPRLANDTSSWFEEISKLLDEPRVLQDLEAKIKNEFVPRTWNEFCRDFYKFIVG
ncbi:glycosyltransferase family 4 protein [Vibrio cholerae]|uniref:glycosyltransferase n=1 Tax=Vibrio cholerae TaxID=666 RepID=UPI0011DA6648|nr:glycosyltransferase [Vibrio cholerae]EGR0581294.1 glycosyltransferase family 4 protein [Vibrio cholerae]TXY76640.1 glycosyltransferase family 4 protein [Vibrio cholerae]BCN21217.1 putative glycosyltransferase [Vibrio cholerae]BCN21880.1 putative glycosyltransferase [Vibrio cholerae]GHX92001.1 glycosyl transferases group 1 family protein [Vibrio cholerae]